MLYKAMIGATKMTPQQIKDNAPEGAEEYGVFIGMPVYYKNIEGMRHVYNHKYKGWDVPMNYLKKINPL